MSNDYYARAQIAQIVETAKQALEEAWAEKERRKKEEAMSTLKWVAADINLGIGRGDVSRLLDMGTGVLVAVISDKATVMTFVPGTAIVGGAIVARTDVDREQELQNVMEGMKIHHEAMQERQRAELQSTINTLQESLRKSTQDENALRQKVNAANADRDAAIAKWTTLQREIAAERARNAKSGLTVIAAEGGELAVADGAGAVSMTDKDAIAWRDELLADASPKKTRGRKLVERLFGDD